MKTIISEMIFDKEMVDKVRGLNINKDFLQPAYHWQDHH
jgi:hypothetical protein